MKKLMRTVRFDPGTVWFEARHASDCAMLVNMLAFSTDVQWFAKERYSIQMDWVVDAMTRS